MPGGFRLEKNPQPNPAPVENEEFPEEVQLGGVGGMAVNYSGAGGVPAGTVYAATRTAEGGTADRDV